MAGSRITSLVHAMASLAWIVQDARLPGLMRINAGDAITSAVDKSVILHARWSGSFP